MYVNSNLEILEVGYASYSPRAQTIQYIAAEDLQYVLINWETAVYLFTFNMSQVVA